MSADHRMRSEFMVASDRHYTRRRILRADTGNAGLVIQLTALLIGVPAVIIAIAAVAGTHWLEAMIGTAVVLVAAFLILSAISLFKS